MGEEAAVPADRWERIDNLLSEGLRYLARRDEPVHKSALEDHLREFQIPNADEVVIRSSDGSPSWLNWYHWKTSGYTSAGWVSKQRGYWSITPSGSAAVEEFATPEALAAELHRLYRERRKSHRVFLVRGSVGGVNLVRQHWLTEGRCSQPAQPLRKIEPDENSTGLAAAVEEGYAESAFYARQRKTAELRLFLRTMKIGDVVVTTSEGKFYVGDVIGGWTQAVGDPRETFQRPVDWRNANNAIDYNELPAALQNKLGSNFDCLEVTAEAFEYVNTVAPETEPEVDEREPEAQPEVEAVVVIPHDALRTLTAAEADELLIDQSWADELVELLNERKQLVFYGPPGTGKTYLAHKIAEHLVGPEQVRLVQFHPAYTYEDFFEGYRPATGDGTTISFQLRPGPLRDLADKAKKQPDLAFVLIIDEINRANLAKVFGELYFLLEYRDKGVQLLYSDETFSLPKNVYIIGTMNTADRSIALVDGAMRRRFAFLPLDPGVPESPSATVLGRWLERNEMPTTAARLLQILNARIDDEDLRIGPSYFMKSTDHSRPRMARIWRTSIIPLLEEHHYGEWASMKDRYDFERLWSEAEAR